MQMTTKTTTENPSEAGKPNEGENRVPANGELKDGELNAVTGGLGGNLATAVVKGVNTARDEHYLSQQH
jgi:hypothetical protein